ncbi:type 1 glutamine amidotransferase domain-containing protein [Chryseobacterium sp. OSA05B]|uniref:type 1 glutamine amidotransferase domain-containing protein n=1 Tax=Chryseobacterium sp. OSA05B TaxID=2862650 RepID=UPI001CC194E2|nr:type 1 glutamine amidotransferase domain-containing protein [Chryseobacterium sp. OSA05B]
MKNYITYFPVLIAFLAIMACAEHKNKPVKKEEMKHQKVLFVTTSFDEVKSNGQKTGLWIEEFATPYYALALDGAEITVATPNGGNAPIDPKSTQPEYSTEAVKKFYSDPAAQQKLARTIALKDIKAEDYDAVFYPGGHGPMWDLPENSYSISLIKSFYDAGKPIALVCHGPAALKNVVDKKGIPLVKGRKISGYTNTEESSGQTLDMVPFSLEDMLKEKGADYVKGEDWKPYSVQDGQWITGQNPASAELVAKQLISNLNK